MCRAPAASARRRRGLRAARRRRRTASGVRGNSASSHRRGSSSSVLGRPATPAAMPVPEVTTRSFPVPASASPRASIARRSCSQFSANFEKSWLNARWTTASAAWAPLVSASGCSMSPRWTSAPASRSACAPASLRARPRTRWPAPTRSSFVYLFVPMNPVAPVTNTRIDRTSSMRGRIARAVEHRTDDDPGRERK